MTRATVPRRVHVRGGLGPRCSRPPPGAQDPRALDPVTVSRTPEPARYIHTRLAAISSNGGVGRTRSAANGRSSRDERTRVTFGTRGTAIGPKAGGPQSARPRRDARGPGALDPTAVSRTSELARYVQTRLAANDRPIGVGSTRCAANGRSSRDRITRGTIGVSGTAIGPRTGGPQSTRLQQGARDPGALDPNAVSGTSEPARCVHTGLAAGCSNVGAGSARSAANCRSCRDGRPRGAFGARGTAIDPQTGGLQSTRLQRDAQNPRALDPNAVSGIPEPTRNVQTRLAANGRLVGVESTRCAANGRSCRDRRGRGTFGTRDTTVGPQTGGPQSARPRRNVQDPGAFDPTAVSRTPEPARHVQPRLAANGRLISVGLTRYAANGCFSRNARCAPNGCHCQILLTRNAHATRTAVGRIAALAATRRVASVPRHVAPGCHSRTAANGCSSDVRMGDRRIRSYPIGGRILPDRPDRRFPRGSRFQERGPKGSHGTRSRRRGGFQCGHSRGPHCVPAGTRLIPGGRARPFSIPPHGPPASSRPRGATRRRHPSGAAARRPGPERPTRAATGPASSRQRRGRPAARGASRGLRSGSRPGATRRGECTPRPPVAHAGPRVGDLSLPLGCVQAPAPGAALELEPRGLRTGGDTRSVKNCPAVLAEEGLTLKTPTKVRFNPP